MNNITFVIFSYNEEKRIKLIIDNLKGYGEILIIDNFSTDNTKKIAEKLGARVCQFQNQGLVETKEELKFVKANIQTEYMTWSYCDWVWPIELLKEIVSITNKNIVDCIDTIQYNYHYGLEKLNFLTFFGGLGKKNWKGFCVAFKTNCIEIDGIIHANIKIKGKNIYVIPRRKEYYIHHLSVYNISTIEIALNKYSDIEAKMLFNSGYKSSLIKTISKIIFFFIKFFFIEGGYKSGKKGFIMVMQYMFFYLNVWGKHYELENNISLKNIENSYTQLRNKLLK